MKKENLIGYIISITLILAIGILSINAVSIYQKQTNQEKRLIESTVLYVDDTKVMVQDKNHVIYTFNAKNMQVDIGDELVIEYAGLLDKNRSLQDGKILNYQRMTPSVNKDGIPNDWLDDGIFKDYYQLAYQKLKELTQEERIGQILLVRYPDSDAKAIEALKKYHFGGYVFFERDFKDKTEAQVKKMIEDVQKKANVPLLTAVDEEGGTVTRVSSNPNLVSEKFKSPRELYQAGGFDKIREDTINKSKILKNLGLNLNLAPVVDVSTNSTDYMYNRTLGEDTTKTATFAKTVIEASKNTGVSYTLKHFPGYGNNNDTHTGSVLDDRPYDDIIAFDIPPFKAGIDVGAEAVLVSHNTVENMDANLPASLSPSVHNLLRNELDFTGIIITDDLAMGATSSIDEKELKAILAGNDLIITTDYEESINTIKAGLLDGTISQSQIDKLAFRVLAWKYYKGLMFENHK